MNKRFYVLILVIMLLSLGGPSVALAQDGEDEELNCPAFPNSPADVRTSYYVGEGMGYAASGQLASAIYSFSCIIEQIDPGYVPAYMMRGALHTERRSYDLAVEDFTSAIGRNANLIAAYNNRGIVYAAQQEYDLALEDFNRVLQIDGSYVIGYNNRAVVYAIRGDYDAAITDLEQAIAVSGIAGVITELSDPERPADAEPPVYDRDHAQAYALLGIIYSAQALDNYNKYLLLTGSQGDRRVQSAAGALESRFSFELRLDDGTWLFTAAFSPIGE